MFFSLDVRRARQGDCLMLHYGSKDDPGLALIDGGPSQVYEPYLRPRLEEIRNARRLDADTSLPVDLLMVSHIDEDHIYGILELTKELITSKDKGTPLPFKIRSFWHNTFDRIMGNTPDELLAAVTASFGPAALRGEPDTEGLDPDVAMVLASVGQGLRLGDDARKLNLINREFRKELVMAKEDGAAIEMAKGLKLTVIGPMRAELVKLQKEYDDFLKKHPEQRESPAALAAFTKDNSPANLSSIVVLAEAGNKRMLLTGDARGDKIIEGLQFNGLLGPEKNSTSHVDVLKMPHHGSTRNVEQDFFKRITAGHYVFSGNGEYGNPERQTLEMLWNARGDEDYTVHLTYPIEEIDQARKEDWIKEQNKEKNKKKKKPETQIRPDWSPEEHSLTAFFKNHKNFAKKISIVEKTQPHVIDLLNKVGF
jgi:hypothetical protein